MARFSSSTGNPHISESDPTADPRGFAVRIGNPPVFVLVGHSVEAFPARTGGEFLTFLKTLNLAVDHPEGIDRYMSEHQAARRFGAARKVQSPASFAEQTYHMLHPFRLIRRDRTFVVGRLTVAGSCAALREPRNAMRGADYLDRDLRTRLDGGDVELVLRFHRAPERVDIENISAPWPGRGETTDLGRIVLTRLADDQKAQEHLTFDPGVLPFGIAFAGDPMIEVRLAAYQLAFQRRLREEHA